MSSFGFGLGLGLGLGRGGVRSAPDAQTSIPVAIRLQTFKGFGSGKYRPLGLYKDTACTIPATQEGDLVAAWRDELSGSGAVAIQSTLAYRPVLVFVRGIPRLRFSGSQWLRIVTGVAFAEYSIATVVRQNTYGGASGNVVVSKHDFATFAGSTFGLLLNSGASPGVIEADTYVGGSYSGAQGISPANAQPLLLVTSRATGGAQKLWVNDNAVIAGNTLSGSSNSTAGDIGIGARGSGTPGAEQLNGDVFSVLVSAQVWTDAAVATIKDATRGIWGSRDYVATGAAIASQNYRAYAPTTLNGALVAYLHGSGETEASLSSDAAKTPLLNDLLESGYCVVTSAAHGQNWGNQSGIDDYAAAINAVKTAYGLTGLLLWSESMGGLAGLTGLATGAYGAVKAWAGVSPVCSLADVYANGSFTSLINTAYNIPGGGTYAQQTSGFDPLRRLASHFSGQRMRFYASPDDVTITKADHTDPMAAMVGSTAAEAGVVVTSGAHTATTRYNRADMLSFFDRCR